jgi:hypothetical protein
LPRVAKGSWLPTSEAAGAPGAGMLTRANKAVPPNRERGAICSAARARFGAAEPGCHLLAPPCF